VLKDSHTSASEQFRKKFSRYSIPHFIKKTKQIVSEQSVKAAFLQGLRTLFSILLLVAVPHFTTPKEQGLWSIFVSLGALSTLVELGFSGLFVVFAAHSKCNNVLSGQKAQQERASFARFVLIWSTAASALFLPAIFAIGYFIISRQHLTASWQIPWGLYSIAISASVFTNFISSWYEGSQSVTKAFYSRTISTLASVVTTVLVLYFIPNIIALPIGIFVACSVQLGILLPSILETSATAPSSLSEIFKKWFAELSALLRRNAASFFGGYISFQSPTIMTYLVKGPEEAGKVGFTMTSWMGAFTVFHTMLSSNAAAYGELWAQGRATEALQISRQKLVQAMTLFIPSAGIAVAVMTFFSTSFRFIARLAAPADMLILACGLTLHLAVAAVAIYARSGKNEPFSNISLLSAACSIVATYFAIRCGLSPFFGFLFGNVLTVLWIELMWKDFRLTTFKNLRKILNREI